MGWSRAVRWVLVAAGVAVASGCVPPPAADPLTPRPGSDDLRVMTYNVLGAQADGNVYDEHGGVAARIDQLAPDVVVLQEAQSDDVVAISTRAHGYSIASYLQWVCDAKPAPEGVAILVRDATVAVTGSGTTHVGSSCTDPTVRRVLVWADIEVSGAALRVYGTHLTAGGGTAASSRENQVRAIRSIIAADDPDRAGRWILAGDVNTTPGAAAYLLLRDGEVGGPDLRMADTFAEVHPGADDRGTCPTYAAGDTAGAAYLLAHPEVVAACGYSAGWPKDDNLVGCDLLSLCISWEQRRDLPVRERIDDVFRAAGGPVSVADAFVPSRSDPDWAAVGSEWFHLSDHLPTVVDLDVAPV